VKALAIVHPLSKLSPSDLRDTVDRGPIVLADDMARSDAMLLAARLKLVGAITEIFVSVDDCC
jgi:ribosomal protein L7/L12